MSRACATFATDTSIVGTNSKLWVFTSLPTTSGIRDNIQQFIDSSDLWGYASGSRMAMEAAIRQALTTGSTYPAEEGEAMLNTLGWSEGLHGLLEAELSSLKLTLNSDTCRLLPELVPVHHADDTPAWLDRMFPVYRTLYHVDQRQVERCQERSLAIVHQEEEPFSYLAKAVRRDLYGKLDVDVYAGTEFPSSPSERFSKLEEVFYKHRAVLFLGHLHRPKDGTPGGWKLASAPEVSLSMRELHALLGGGRRSPRSQQHPRRTSRGVYIPEVVFSSCCCGAWGDPATEGRTEAFYPELFLDAGVRFFIGTWMDVVLRHSHLNEDREIIWTLVSRHYPK